MAETIKLSRRPDGFEFAAYHEPAVTARARAG